MSSIEAEKTAYQGGNAAANASGRRRAALAEIDEAKFSWWHVKACLVAGESARSIDAVVLLPRSLT